MKEIFTATMKESHTESSALLQSATVENREFGEKEIRKNKKPINCKFVIEEINIYNRLPTISTKKEMEMNIIDNL